MFERFTDQARKVIVLAQENSRREGHLSIDVGHIGLAALTAGEGAGLDDDLVQRLQQALRSTLADQVIDHKHTGHIPFTTATKTTFERSLHRSLQDRRNYIDSRDLLLVVCLPNSEWL
ncbi:MAG: hypothetical protein L0I24_02775 [Pseudonocardia sp.]|nr:hypothetical protein [Pseudonocardia sp.]